MTDPTQSLYKNITLNDVQLASFYFPLLVDLARNKHCVPYGELVERAKATYPETQVVQRAIAVSTGRKLDVVRLFTADRGLPDLTCLIVNKGTGECGSGFTDHFDPIEARKSVFEFDWSSVSTEFDGFLKRSETAITPRRKRLRSSAAKVMAEFYTLHKAELPSSIRNMRELIIELLMEGLSPEDAFEQAKNAT